MKVIPVRKNGNRIGWMVHCPACKIGHVFDNGWKFNGDQNKPTFSPSMLVQYPWGDPPKDVRCHSYVREGKIQFLGDCTHDMKGKTIDLPNIEEDN